MPLLTCFENKCSETVILLFPLLTIVSPEQESSRLFQVSDSKVTSKGRTELAISLIYHILLMKPVLKKELPLLAAIDC